MSKIVRTADRKGENRSRDSVEVSVLWNGSTIEVEHFGTAENGPRDFTIGEEPNCDFMVPSEVLDGETRVSLVSIRDGKLRATFPGSARGAITFADGTMRVLGDGAGDDDAFSGEWVVDFAHFERMEIQIGPFVFVFCAVTGESEFSAPVRIDWSSKNFFGISVFLHAVVLFIAYLIPPDANGLVFDPDGDNNRFISILLVPPQMAATPLLTPEIAVDRSEDMGGARTPPSEPIRRMPWAALWAVS